MADQKVSDLTSYTPAIDTDIVPIVDSTSSTTKKISWANIKATLKTYFDTLYPSGSGTSTGSNTGDQSVPVKASGAEVDTGTDDAKFVTAKAINDSHNVPDVAPSTSGNVMTSNGTDWTSATPSAGGVITLLKANSGTDTTTSATNLDTLAISGLTAKDTLLIYLTWSPITQAPNAGNYQIYSNTDAVQLARIGIVAVAAGQTLSSTVFLRQNQSADTEIVGNNNTADTGNGSGSVNTNRSTVTTVWTGSWTLAMRYPGMVSGGTMQWSWAVYRVAGQ